MIPRPPPRWVTALAVAFATVVVVLALLVALAPASH